MYISVNLITRFDEQNDKILETQKCDLFLNKILYVKEYIRYVYLNKQDLLEKKKHITFESSVVYLINNCRYDLKETLEEVEKLIEEAKCKLN